MKKLGAMSVLFLVLGGLPALAEEKPPEGKPLREILQSLEEKGYSQVGEAVYRKGTWKIEAYKGGERRILQVDSKSAEIKADRKDDDD